MSIKLEMNKENILIATIDQAGRTANVINDESRKGFESLIKKLKSDDNIEGVIITSGKDDFVVGGDIDAIYAIKNEKEAFEVVETFKGFLRELETCGRPVIAALNGTALGGGLELALACHYRIALDEKKLKLGLPEVMLGLLPGAGGTQRLARLIGIQNAAPLMFEGRKLSATEGQELGIIHELASTKEDMMEKASKWIRKNPTPKQPWDKKDFQWPGGDPVSGEAMNIWAVGPSMINQKAWGNYPAPIYIMACLFEGTRVDFDTALRIESAYFAKCVLSKESHNMINTLWYQLNDIKKGKYRLASVPKYTAKKVGVIGAGMMGAGIAYVSASAGIDVVLKDVTNESADKGKDYSRNLLAKRVKKGKMTEAKAEEILSRIKPTGDAKDFEGCDLIVEAVFEKRELKAKVTKEASEHMLKDGIFASNTSTLPITGLAEQYPHPENFIGLHFFSPVDKMQLVEIITGAKTSPETLAKSFDYVQQINKIPIIVNDSRGFYTSRVFQTYVMEGMALLAEGENPASIETLSFMAGMPVGPLALADELSLRLMAEIFETTKKDLLAEGKKVTESPGMEVVFKLLNEFKREGKKAGAGLYEYPKEGKKFLWPKLKEVFPSKKAPMSEIDMRDRILFAQAVEAARCYEEKVVTNTGDANVGSIFGWGFAPFKGGVLQFINDYGTRDFVVRAQDLTKKYGPRFSPPASLVKLAEKNAPIT